MNGMRSPFRIIEGGLKKEDLSSEVRLSRTKEEGRSLHELEGWIFTSLGVLCFSLSFVSARLALRGFDPFFIALARGAGAGTIAFLCAFLGKYPVPTGKQVLRLCLAAVGIVFIFPILTTVALQSAPASHAATVAAILPLLTAVFGVWRKHEPVPVLFWVIAAAGTAVVAWYLISRVGGIELRQADMLIIVACVACSYGYAEGGLLAQEMGGWRAICWMLVFSGPVALVLFFIYLIARGPLHPVESPSAWFGFSVYRVRLVLSGFSPGWCCPDEPGSTISIGVSGTRSGLNFGRADRCSTLGGTGALVGSGGGSAMGDGR
jgi:drug/metabolite transporter (DMT)-like permease